MAGASSLMQSFSISWNGMDVKLSIPNFETEALYEQFLHKRAYQSLKNAQSEMSESEYKYALSVWISQGPLGYYRWGGEAWSSSLTYENNFKQFLMYWINQDNIPSFSPEQTAKFYKDMAEKVVEAFRLLILENPTTPSSQEGMGVQTTP